MQALICPLKNTSYSCTDPGACRTTVCCHPTSALFSMHYSKLQLVRLTKDNRDSKNIQVSPDSRKVRKKPNPSPCMVAGGHLATGSPRLQSSKVASAPAESLLFSDALKAWQMPPSNSVLPNLDTHHEPLLVIYIHLLLISGCERLLWWDYLRNCSVLEMHHTSFCFTSSSLETYRHFSQKTLQYLNSIAIWH